MNGFLYTFWKMYPLNPGDKYMKCIHSYQKVSSFYNFFHLFFLDGTKTDYKTTVVGKKVNLGISVRLPPI